MISGLRPWTDRGAEPTGRPSLDALALLLTLQLAGMLLFSRLALWLVLPVMLLAALKRCARPHALGRVLALCGIPAGMLLASSLLHAESHPQLGKSLQFAAMAGCAWAILGLRDRLGVLRRGLELAAWALLAVAAWQVLGQGHARAFGTSNPIPFGNAGLLIAGTLLVLAVEAGPGRGRLRLGLAATAALLGAGLAGSRGGLLALPLWAGLVGLAWVRQVPRPGGRPPAHRRSVVLALMLMTAVLVGSAIALHPRTQLESHEPPAAGHAPGEIGQRLQMWALGRDALRDAPWAGHAWGEVLACGPRDAGLPRFHTPCPKLGPIRHLHNDFLSAAAVAGLPGLLALLGFWGAILWRCSTPLRRPGPLGPLALLPLGLSGSLLAFTLTDSLFGTVNGTMVYGLLMAWALALIDQPGAVQGGPRGTL